MAAKKLKSMEQFPATKNLILEQFDQRGKRSGGGGTRPDRPSKGFDGEEIFNF